jgi:hypothetical protein
MARRVAEGDDFVILGMGLRRVGQVGNCCLRQGRAESCEECGK